MSRSSSKKAHVKNGELVEESQNESNMIAVCYLIDIMIFQRKGVSLKLSDFMLSANAKQST